jgi:hypothetical protein
MQESSRMHPNISRLARTLIIAAVAGATACAPLGGWGDILLPGGNTMSGEIRSVDTRWNRIDVRQDYGRDQRLRYDNRTRVHDGMRTYPVSTLRRGDRVRVRVTQDRNGTVWADRIELRADARSRDGRSGRVERVDGRVLQIDTRRGYFVIDRGLFTTTTVFMPSRPRRDDLRRFERLQRGDRVRAEVRLVGRTGQAELVRFR